MREVKKDSYQRKRKKKKKSGCCLGRLLFLLVIFTLVGVLGFKALEGLGLKNYMLQVFYPIRYQAFVEEYAKEFGLDEALVYAVIHTESRFDTYAESSAGAKGLMQLQDDTGRDCAKKLKMTDFTTDQLFDPKVNIRLGCYYLKKLIGDYDGITQTAIAAYNGGPGNVNGWLKNPAYSSGDGTLTEIPFRETRNYVKKVTEAYWNYQTIYNLN